MRHQPVPGRVQPKLGGPKAVAFHTSAVLEQKAELSLPRAEAEFQQEWGPQMPGPTEHRQYDWGKLGQ